MEITACATMDARGLTLPKEFWVHSKIKQSAYIINYRMALRHSQIARGHAR